jgi:hypothetical protein
MKHRIESAGHTRLHFDKNRMSRLVETEEISLVVAKAKVRREDLPAKRATVAKRRLLAPMLGRDPPRKERAENAGDSPREATTRPRPDRGLG